MVKFLQKKLIQFVDGKIERFYGRKLVIMSVSIKRFLFIILLLSTNFNQIFANPVGDYSISNCTVGANFFEFQLNLTNSSTSGEIFHLCSASPIRINHAAGIIPSGTNTFTWAYIPNSADASLAPIYATLGSSYNMAYTPSSRLMQITNNSIILGNSTASVNCPIQPGATLNCGRFRLTITNTNFIANQQVGLTWVTTSGFTAYVGNSTSITNFNTTSNRTLGAFCSLTTSAACTAPSITATVNNQSCLNQNNGSINITAVNGSPAPTFIWTGPNNFTASSEDINGLAPGAYTVIASSSSCSTSQTFTVNAASAITSSFSASGCSSYILPWGTAVTSSGTFSHIYISAAGCDSTVTANITINNGSFTSTAQSACNSFAWNGTTYTQSGIYTYRYTNSQGCSSADTLKLTIKNSSSSNAAVTICNTQLPYLWNGISCTAAGTYNKTISNVSGCDSAMTLVLTTTTTIPASSASITQTLVVNVCGGKIYRYTAAAVTGATGYQWQLPNAVGGITGVSLDSGEATSSRIIRVKYLSNNAALTTDSIFVKSFNACGSSRSKSAKLTNTLLSAPAAPSSLTITALQTNVCGSKIYRYAAPLLPAATSTAVVATGYMWSFTGTLGANAILDSGSVNSRVIKVKFTQNQASVTGDSVRICYTSACGNSSNKSSKLTNTLLAAPAIPASIVIMAVQTNVCGAKIYRYSAPALSAATTTAVVATGYVWSFTGTLGMNAIIDSGTLGSQTIRVRFSSNAAASSGDSVRVAYISSCGNSANRSSRLTNTLLGVPAAPSAITITALQTNICGSKIYRYAAPLLPTATTSTGAATGYQWSFTGTLGTTATIDSGTSASQIIRVTFTSSLSSAIGDSVRVLYTSVCGNSINRSVKLTNTSIAVPSAPASILIVQVSDTCSKRIYRYTAPALPNGSTTTAPATGYFWTLPTGTVGITGVLDSGTLSGRTIRIKYSSNATAPAGDSIRVKYTSSCGNSTLKAQKLSNLAKAGCPSTFKNNYTKINAETSIPFHIYPTPFNDYFVILSICSTSLSGELLIINQFGTVVKKQKLTQRKHSINTTNFQKGIYYIKLQMKGFSSTIKTEKI
jgi:hypothetical protein